MRMRVKSPVFPFQGSNVRHAAALLCGTALTLSLALLPASAGAQEAAALPAGTVQLPNLTIGAARESATTAVPGFTATTSATASKTDTPLLETPQSVSVITAGQMEARNIQSVKEALSYSAGVRTGTYGFSPRFDDFILRGFDATYTGLFRDGLRQSGNSFAIFRTEPYGLSAINVLRGPGSALYGSATAGGFVNLVTKRPLFEPFGEVELQIGNHDRLQTRFDLGGPLGEEGRAAYRVTGLWRDADTQNASVPDDRIYIAPAFTWKADDRTTITLLGAYQRDLTGGTVTSYYDAQRGLTRLPSGDPAFNDFHIEHWRLGYELEHRLTQDVTLRQNLRFGHIDTDLEYSYILGIAPDGRSATRGAGLRRQQLNTLAVDNQAEWRFTTGAVQHTILAGIDYLYTSYRSSGGDYYDAPSLDLVSMNYGQQAFRRPDTTLRSSQRQDQLGVYVQDQMRLGQWILTLSGRHDWVETTTRDRIAGSRDTQSDNAFSGRAGLLYAFESGVSPYVSYASSFYPAVGTNTDGSGFKPITAEQWEAGVKYQPPGRNSMITASVFHITQRNGIFGDPLSFGFQGQRGEVRSRGFELEGSADLGEGLKLLAAYTYLDPKITEASDNTEGKVPSGQPRHLLSGWADYTISDGPLRGLGFGLGARFIGSSYRDDDNSGGKVGAVTLFDAAIRYDLDALAPELRGMRLAVNATNLGDRDYSSCAQSYCYWGDGRTVIGSLRYRW
ncbi:TonB-dependent siderophore receptor [Pseudoroseomonas cervicalis]|uniref:TonB-dependent siderophore receptor n=1 Tax=Teichococcus cervicalis TaxID=204525 RepID=UPI0027868D6F|nr:TonB-dependent siderophore receptor [Pseudoroseomonas cervicalis]MDQ1081105.1 iron complex outermembrane receptor protein [Pseudoroseomonas cervicalis]